MRIQTASLLLPLLLAAGCASQQHLDPQQERIRELTWRLEASEQAAEQATVDQRLAQREADLARRDAKVLGEKLSLAHDALRNVRAEMDVELHDRVTQLSESSGGGDSFAISQYGGVVLESGILFPSGRHKLTNAGKQALEPIVETLLKPEYEAYEIELAGHTDSDPIRSSAKRYRDNHDLASMRANSVRRFLVESGLPAEKISFSSWGALRAISPAEKKLNRRVEIVLHKVVDTDAALPASATREEEQVQETEEN